MLLKSISVKSSFLLLLMLLGIGSAVHAQYYWEEDNRLGIKISPTLERFSAYSSLRTSESSILGYSFGAFALFPISRHFTLQAELLLHGKGANFLGFDFVPDTSKVSDKYTLRMNFLEVPILASYVSGPLHVSVGPYIAYRISYRATGFEFKDTITARPSSSDIIKFDYGLAGDIAIRNDVYIIGIRGQYGIPKISASQVGELYFGKGHFYSASIYVGIIL